MNILVSVNNAFVYPLKVLLFSVAQTQSEPITVFLLNASISPSLVKELETEAQLWKITLQVIDLPDDLKEFFRELQTAVEFQRLHRLKLSVETYFRLFVQELLPPEIDRVLWLDADCLVQQDLAEFYYQPFQGRLLVGCDSADSFYSQNSPLNNFRVSPVFPKCTGRYLNAGVILFNLTEIRRQGLLEKEKVLSLIQASVLDRPALEASVYRRFEYFDQDILNYLFQDQILWMDPLVYNCAPNQNFLGGLGADYDMVPVLAAAKIIHYCSSEEKPWVLGNNLLDKYARFWKKAEKVYKQRLKLIN